MNGPPGVATCLSGALANKGAPLDGGDLSVVHRKYFSFFQVRRARFMKEAKGRASIFSVANAGGDDIGLLAAADGFGGLDDIDEIMLGFEAESCLNLGQVKGKVVRLGRARVGETEVVTFGQPRDSLAPVDDCVAAQGKLLANGLILLDT